MGVVMTSAKTAPAVAGQRGLPRQLVTFTATAKTPPGTGDIVKVEWDFAGTGSFTASALPHVGPSVRVSRTQTFTKPGTYFAVVRITSQADGNRNDPYSQVQNLASVRVVVT